MRKNILLKQWKIASGLTVLKCGLICVSTENINSILDCSKCTEIKFLNLKRKIMMIWQIPMFEHNNTETNARARSMPHQVNITFTNKLYRKFKISKS